MEGNMQEYLTEKKPVRNGWQFTCLKLAYSEYSVQITYIYVYLFSGSGI